METQFDQIQYKREMQSFLTAGCSLTAIIHQMSDNCCTHGFWGSAFGCCRQLVSWENSDCATKWQIEPVSSKQRLNIGCVSVNLFFQYVGLLSRMLAR